MRVLLVFCRSSPSDDAVCTCLAHSPGGDRRVYQCQATREVDDQFCPIPDEQSSAVVWPVDFHREACRRAQCSVDRSACERFLRMSSSCSKWWSPSITVAFARTQNSLNVSGSFSHEASQVGKISQLCFFRVMPTTNAWSSSRRYLRLLRKFRRRKWSSFTMRLPSGSCCACEVAEGGFRSWRAAESPCAAA